MEFMAQSGSGQEKQAVQTNGGGYDGSVLPACAQGRCRSGQSRGSLGMVGGRGIQATQGVPWHGQGCFGDPLGSHGDTSLERGPRVQPQPGSRTAPGAFLPGGLRVGAPLCSLHPAEAPGPGSLPVYGGHGELAAPPALLPQGSGLGPKSPSSWPQGRRCPGTTRGDRGSERGPGSLPWMWRSHVAILPCKCAGLGCGRGPGSSPTGPPAHREPASPSALRPAHALSLSLEYTKS